MAPKIFIAFRFHGNFYHSYRGDTPDELGFGKDIRIIRHLIETLDALNRGGIPVRAAWDFENYFSLEQIMPAHCPELISGLQRRAAQAGDEMQLMAYNNGLISAHSPREFEAAIRRGISNPQGSGLRDLFGEAFYPMVRPQEMLYTPIHLKLYRACGISSISLFYSALPFNGFSNFIPPLGFAERYNPLTLAYPGIAETMTLLPCYNTGDLVDHLSLPRWVKQMRKQQLALPQPQDLLLLIDMDADDEFWVGYDAPLLKGRFSTAGGLKGLVESVAGLGYLEFTTPGRYLNDHAPLKEIVIRQDTADGSFDGLSSWAEKWSNQRLWSGLERARILDLQTRRLLGEAIPPPVQALLDEAFEARLKLLSTTHFGMASPVMNLTREGIARALVDRAVQCAGQAFQAAAGAAPQGGFSLLDYRRGESSDLLAYPSRPARALVRLGLARALRQGAPPAPVVEGAAGSPLASAVLPGAPRDELLFVARFGPDERIDYRLLAGESPAVQKPVRLEESRLENEFLRLKFDSLGQVVSLQFEGGEYALERLLESSLVYHGKRRQVASWTVCERHSLGLVGALRQRGEVSVRPGMPAVFERELLLVAGLPYLYINMRVSYPRTPDRGFSPGKAQRLQQGWDNAWQAVLPCEIRPALNGSAGSPLRVWKHNACDHISSYTLDYGRFSKNDTLDSANNQVTSHWLALSDGVRGLLLAQSADSTSGMAFCPLRTRRQGQQMRVLLNPFGSYWGRQYHYASADTGLGKLLAVALSASDHINPYAPSYNGRQQVFSLLLAPYAGDAPPEALRSDAEAFSYPYLLLHDPALIASPPHRSWDGSGLGQPPG
jgi:hypothetical protein